MSSPLSSAERVFDILPDGYISSVQHRIDVHELSKEKIQELMKTANVFEQEVILQDLLLAGRKGQTLQQRNMVALAAELFVKAPEETQRDFLMHLVGVKPILKTFATAMFANFIFHESIESMKEGSSGLTADQLNTEKAFAITLDKHRQ